jgi:hypothetical protein
MSNYPRALLPHEMRQMGAAAQPQMAGASAAPRMMLPHEQRAVSGPMAVQPFGIAPEAPNGGRGMLPHEQRMTIGVPAPGVPPHQG